MPDNTPMGVADRVEAKAAPASKGAKGDKRRQQVMVGGTILLVMIAYLTYRKMAAGKAAATGSGGATVTPVSGPGVPTLPLETGTNIPSGSAAPTTTTPFAAPTDTTGGGTIPTTSGTTQVAGGSSTVPPVKPPAPVGPPTGPPQAQSPTPHPAGHPALFAPVVAPHPVGMATVAAVPALTHPVTASGTV